MLTRDIPTQCLSFRSLQMLFTVKHITWQMHSLSPSNRQKWIHVTLTRAPLYSGFPSIIFIFWILNQTKPSQVSDSEIKWSLTSHSTYNRSLRIRVVRILHQRIENMAHVTNKFCTPFSWVLRKFCTLSKPIFLLINYQWHYRMTLFVTLVYLLSFTQLVVLYCV